jgi:hypothetical protein
MHLHILRVMSPCFSATSWLVTNKYGPQGHPATERNIPTCPRVSTPLGLRLKITRELRARLPSSVSELSLHGTGLSQAYFGYMILAFLINAGIIKAYTYGRFSKRISWNGWLLNERRKFLQQKEEIQVQARTPQGCQ